ncbi:MAG: glycosyltransferase family 2 protein, partial [Acidimicrobiales bacterium]
VPGFFAAEPGAGGGAPFRWTGGRAVLRLGVAAGAGVPSLVELRLGGRDGVGVVLETSGGRARHTVGVVPAWYEAPAPRRWSDVVNSAGGMHLPGGYGADRGFQEPDHGQFDHPADLEVWTGSAVVLSAPYLADVGLFDERLFLYYEDFDLSWRGRRRGWRYRYVPEAVARHTHSASAGAGSDLTLHHLERNRLVALARNAPWPLVASAVARWAGVTAMWAGREAWASWRAEGRVRADVLRQRCRFFAGFLRLLPGTLARRRADSWAGRP